MARKLRVGWFSFSCCEDSTITFTELLNDHWREWKNRIDFRSALVLQRREDLSELDVAFVEGAIASPAQEEKLKKIRDVAKKLVAIGSCACAGLPSGQRNAFDEPTRSEISPILTQFGYAATVKKLSDIIRVDDQVNGCPMDEKVFLQVLNKYIQEFHIGENSDAHV